MFQRKLAQLGSMGKKVAVVAGGAMVSSAAFAVDHSTAITAAGTDGTTNTTAAVTALIGIVAVVVGVGFIISTLRKS